MVDLPSLSACDGLVDFERASGRPHKGTEKCDAQDLTNQGTNEVVVPLRLDETDEQRREQDDKEKREVVTPRRSDFALVLALRRLGVVHIVEDRHEVDDLRAVGLRQDELVNPAGEIDVVLLRLKAAEVSLDVGADELAVHEELAERLIMLDDVDGVLYGLFDIERREILVGDDAHGAFKVLSELTLVTVALDKENGVRENDADAGDEEADGRIGEDELTEEEAADNACNEQRAVRADVGVRCLDERMLAGNIALDAARLMAEDLVSLLSQSFLPQFLLPHFPFNTGVEENGGCDEEENDAEDKLVEVFNQIEVTPHSLRLILTPPAADIR